MDQTTEQFWRSIHGSAVVWRTITRKPHPCRDCKREMLQGERYLDTAEVIGQWWTAHLCVRCARKPLDYEPNGG